MLLKGLGGASKRREVVNLVRRFNPDIVCIQETKLEVVEHLLCVSLWGSGEVDFSYRPSVGASGGVLTLWDPKVIAMESSSSFENFLIVRGKYISNGVNFRVVNIYAPCDARGKADLWQRLGGLIQADSEARWCVCGDFNSVRNGGERCGRGGGVVDAEVDRFNEFILNSELIDLPLHGRRFTWSRSDGSSMSRLDRFLLSGSWCTTWPNCIQVAILRGLSDHCPLILREHEEDWGPRPFRMMKCWRDFPGYNSFVRDQMGSYFIDGWGGFVLKEKFKLLKNSLRVWHLSHAKNIGSKILEAKERLLGLDLRGENANLTDDDLIIERREVTSTIFSLSRIECSMLWQNSRTKWLLEGDANSKFFHALANSRKRKNLIVLLDVNGIQVEGVGNIRESIFNHFSSQFKSQRISRPDVGNLDFKTISESEATVLVEEFGEDETKQAVWDCDSFKSPGPDGVLAKVLANRLSKVIGNVISVNQSAFVKGRQILDGILIANEIVDEAKKKKKELILFKVDFEKAYDSVEWSYLFSVMRKMNFPWKWRRWISECVRSASASVLVNGSPTDEFTFERGLRQGDPLSPFLFLIAAEGLNAMVNASVHANLYSGFSIGEDVPFQITHLQFADDTLLVADKNWANIRAIKSILLLFEVMSGLKVNFHKSLLVGVNVVDSWLEEAAGVLYCKTGKTPFTYLGLPIGGNPRRLSFWKPVIDKIKSRLSVWKCRNLSMGGRLVLLKAALSSLPVYFLSFFKAPAGIVSIIESLFKSFLWGGDGEARKIHWIHWDKVCLERSQGGLGVRKVKEFNVALLGKWCWRLRTERDGFWRQVLVRKYGESRGVIGEGGRKASGWWKDINSIKNGSFNGFNHWFDNFIFKQVGNGEDSLFWDDPWLEEGVSLRDRFPRLAGLFTDQVVSVGEMCRRGWDMGGGGWSWRRPLFVWEEELLAGCCGLFHNVVLQPNELDRWHWRSLHSYVFTVKGAYQTLTRAEEEAEPMLNSTELVWNKVVPVKVSVFAWRFMENRIPTRDNLFKRGILNIDAQHCVLGCGFDETLSHLFFTCDKTHKVWCGMLQWSSVEGEGDDGDLDHGGLYCEGSSAEEEERLNFVVICCRGGESNFQSFNPDC
ncbi:hypothetical protein TSUD_296020 [Trifolium subterraneum]|uniref:Reverse transcriptase domain-containing protein n=1 Tax=Trifolium subterraneum TaxID=3900 RepID=A0A2Z6LY97_TRISU|nr:hypothetical protein TSUD_296020 [Trifolium subterraneum]